MRIISKQGIKDYYDYLQGILGIDPLVVYDRRECFVIDPSHDKFIGEKVNHYLLWDAFGKSKNIFDEPIKKITKWSSQSLACKFLDEYEDPREKKGWYIQEGRIVHFAVVIGFYAYFYEVERYTMDNGNMFFDHRFLTKEKLTKRHSDAPVYICSCDSYGFYLTKNVYQYIGKNPKIVENPILGNTYIPKDIPAEEAWNNIYEYISSLKDKEIVDNRTDIQHAESHGFDKKTSFRNVK